MEFSKLKLDKFQNIRTENFPAGITLPVKPVTGQTEAIIYYIDKPEDVEKFVKLCGELNLPKENRVIMVYAKGRKDGINRDTIFFPFSEGKYTGFRLRAPMLCSLSDQHSACVMSFNV